MSVFLSNEALAARFVPGPSMERGHALTAFYAHPKEARAVYCFGKYVVVRSLTDSSDNFVYRGHKFDVGCAAFSPNGYWVASGDANGFLRVWSWDNPEHILKVEVQVFAGAIKDLAWDGESKRICVVGDGKGVVAKCVMWDTGNSAGEMVGHSKKAITCAFRTERPYRLMTGSEDFRCVFYKGPPFKMDHSCSEHKNYVNKVAYAPNNDLVCSVGSDKKIVLYDGKEGTVVKELKGDGKAHPQGSVYSCAFSPDSARVLACSADKSVSLFDVASGALVTSKSLGADVGDMQMAALWAHGAPVSVALSGDVLTLDAATLAVAKTVQAPQAPISAMATTQDGVIVAGCNDGTVFRNADGKEWTKVAGAVPRSHVRACHQGKVTAVAPLAGGSFATAGFDDKVRFYDGGAISTDVAVDGQPNGLGGLGGDAVACSTTKGLAVLSGGRLLKFEATSWDPTTLAAAPDGSRFAVGARDGAVRVFDKNLAEVASLPPQRAAITALAWSKDGQWLAAGDADREIKVYDATNAFAVKLQNLWRFHTARVTALAWSPDSKFLASTSNDESIFYWSLDDPQKSAHKYDFCHKDGVTALAFKGNQVVSAGNDGCVCVWNV